jgi:ferritin-like metal-binding protein YciE
MSFRTDNKDDIKRLFIHHLNRMNCTKSYLIKNLPDLAGMAAFKNLKMAILETLEDVKNQQDRVDEIYNLLSSRPSDDGCEVIKAVIEEAYHFGNPHNGLTKIINDMDIILYMRLIENICLTAFGMLKLINKFMGNENITQLLLECCDENADNDKMFKLIADEYLTEQIQQ